MKKFSFRALGAAILSVGLATAGVAAPANAATLTAASATSTSAVGTSGTNASTITFAATTVSAAVNYNDTFYIDLPTGWTFTSTFSGQTCNANTATVTGINLVHCAASNTGTPRLKVANGSGMMPAGIPAGTAITVTLDIGFVNVATARDFTIGTTGWNGTTASDDSAVVTLGASASSTVTFNANNGSGAMADQTANTSTTLSANAFTRTGYTFAGWNTAADGSGTAYADGASYAFSSSTTLYAQWTSVLATTGFDGKPYLYTAFALAITGAALMLLSSRRKQSN